LLYRMLSISSSGWLKRLVIIIIIIRFRTGKINNLSYWKTNILFQLNVCCYTCLIFAL
jgi:hypothetical protein